MSSRPALVSVECGLCGEVISLEVPVTAALYRDDEGDLRIVFGVDNDAVDVQPVWDHQLLAHGPVP